MVKLILPVLFAMLVSACNTVDSNSQSVLTTTGNEEIGEQQNNMQNSYSTKEDTVIFNTIIADAKAKKLSTQKIADIEIAVARLLTNTPYVGATLEKDGDEQLIINLRELDCSTFMENVVALSKCIKENTTDFQDYANHLIKIRYRNGIIDGYPSRLHYSTDWFLDNEKKGLLKIVSNEFGTTDFDATVFFMSKNHEKYRQLANPGFVEQIAAQEQIISQAKLKFIPKNQIEKLESNIKDGDLIGISTTIPGLDFSHVVIAAFKNGRLHFYHASSNKKKVVLSDKPLSQYLAGLKKNDGIVVARLLE